MKRAMQEKAGHYDDAFLILALLHGQRRPRRGPSLRSGIEDFSTPPQPTTGAPHNHNHNWSSTLPWLDRSSTTAADPATRRREKSDFVELDAAD